MENDEPKKLLILRILMILEEHSDCEHRLRQVDIIRLLKSQYGVDCERKAVVRNLEYLQQAGYQLVSNSDGVYFDARKFEPGELRLLVDSVLSNRNVNKKYTRDLIGKLTKEGGKYFRSHIRHVINLDDWQKEENSDFFYQIELLCEAVEKKIKVRFFYNSFGEDKALHPKSESKRLASPFQLLLKNGRYYLMCNYEGCDNMVFCRIDRITGIAPTDETARDLRSVAGYEDGINLGKISNRLPYLYDDRPQRIELAAVGDGCGMIDQVLDWFGKDVNISRTELGEWKFSLTASPKAMRFWILQYGRYIEVLTPVSLRDQIREDIAEMSKLYEEHHTKE